MNKLCGKELDDELAKRQKAKTERRRLRKSFGVRAQELGMSTSEYLAWEDGRDICSHEKYEKVIAGFHPPFFLMEICSKCKNVKIIAKIETTEDIEEHKEEFIEAAKNVGWLEEKKE